MKTNGVHETQWEKAPDYLAQTFGESESASVRFLQQKDWQGAPNATELLFAFLGLPKSGGSKVTRPYSENPWVYRGIRTIVDAVMSIIPIRVKASAEQDAELVEDPAHPLVRLFSRPNPFTNGATMFEQGVVHRNLDGEDFWFMTDTTGAPINEGALPNQIYAWRGKAIEHELDDKGWVKNWRYQSYVPNSSKTIYPRHSVLQFRNYDPDSPQRGVGPISACARAIELMFQSERFDDGLFKNGGHPAVYITTESKLPEEVRAAFERKAKDEISNPSNAGGLKVLTWGAKPIAVGMKPQEMMVTEKSKEWRDTILAALGVPGPCVGVYEFATLNNYREAKIQLWTQTVIPYLENVAATINSWIEQLAEPQFRVLRVAWDYSSVDELIEDDTQRWTLAMQMAQARIGVSLNGAAELLGIDFDRKLGSDVVLDPVDPGLLTGGPAEEDDGEGESSDRQAASLPRGTSSGVVVRSHRAGCGSLESEPPSVDAAGRRALYSAVEKRLLLPSDTRLRAVMLRWLRSFELSQIRRLEAVASGKAKHADGIAVVKGSESITEEQINRILVLNREEWEAKIQNALLRPLSDTYKASLADMAAQLNVPAITIRDPEVVSQLGKQVFQLKSVVTTLRDQVRARLVKAFAADGGATIGNLQQVVSELLPALRAEVKDVFKARAARALTVARTETAHASNTARHLQMLRAGVERTQWLTANDGNERESHARIDGDIVPLGTPFGNGLLYPGQPDARAEEVINCRCIARPIVENDE